MYQVYDVWTIWILIFFWKRDNGMQTINDNLCKSNNHDSK